MSTTPPPQRPDASMDLLNNILRQPLDPDYTADSARDPKNRTRWAKAAVFVVAAALVSGGAVQTAQGAPAAAAERTELIGLIQQQNSAVDAARTQLEQLEAQNRALRQKGLGTDSTDSQVAAQIESLETATGAGAVTGDGVVVTLDDAPGGSTSGVILDLDIRQAVNGLWSAGAEAVSVNGHRLSARTSIRAAGSAITVDYRSITAPYRIEAIGDTSTLRARFAQSEGGNWLAYLHDTQHITYDIAVQTGLSLSADPGLGVAHASIPKK